MKNLLLILMFLFLSAPVFAEDAPKESAYDRVMRTGTLRCGYFVWAPHFQIDMKTGEKSGIYYDMIEELGKTLNLKIEWAYEYTLGQQVEALKTGKVDALCADGPFTRSAMPYVDYSEPYMFLPGYVYALKGNKKVMSFERLNSPDVFFTSIDGDGSADYVQLYFPQARNLSMPSTTDASQLAQNILTGKADAMISDSLSVKAYPQKDQAALKIVGGDKPLAVLPFVVSVNKREPELLAAINQGINLMNDSGVIDKVLNKYDPKGDLCKRPQKRYR